ncbi:MAG: MFS transporter [Bacillales bacterium]|nr:MFS transporter [Bacillales bacterium]
MERNINKIRLAYLSVFMGDALFSPFLALYFISLGFTDFQRSVLLMIIPLGTVVGNYLYGKISKGIKRNILLIKIVTVINMIVALIFGFIANYWVILFLTLIYSLHNNTLFSMEDGVAVKICEKENKQYSTVRSFGSFGYFIVLLLGGFIIDKIKEINGEEPFKWMFLVAALFFVITLVIYFFIVPVNDNSSEDKKKTKITFLEVIKNKTFIKYLIFYFFVLGIWTVGESYCSTYFNELGVSVGEWGYMFAAQVGIEVIILFLGSKLIKNPNVYKFLLYIASIIMSIRFVIMSLPIPLLGLKIAVPLLRGVAWGFFLLSHMPIVKHILGSNLTTKGITLMSIEINLFAALGILISPFIYKNIGFDGMYLLFGIIQIVGIIILFTIKTNLKENY